MQILHKISVLLGIIGILFGIAMLFAVPQTFAQVQNQPTVCLDGSQPIPVDGRDLCPGELGYTLATTTTNLGIFLAIVQVLITIVNAAIFLFFFWNLAKYIRDEDGKEEAKTKMGYSVLAIVVVTSLWGIVHFVRGVIGIQGVESVNSFVLPGVEFDSQCAQAEKTLIIVRRAGIPTGGGTGTLPVTDDNKDALQRLGVDTSLGSIPYMLI